MKPERKNLRALSPAYSKTGTERYIHVCKQEITISLLSRTLAAVKTNKEKISDSYRLFVPFMHEIQEYTMDDKQDVDNDEQVV